MHTCRHTSIHLAIHPSSHTCILLTHTRARAHTHPHTAFPLGPVQAASKDEALTTALEQLAAANARASAAAAAAKPAPPKLTRARSSSVAFARTPAVAPAGSQRRTAATPTHAPAAAATGGYGVGCKLRVWFPKERRWCARFAASLRGSLQQRHGIATRRFALGLCHVAAGTHSAAGTRAKSWRTLRRLGSTASGEAQSEYPEAA